MPSCCEPTGLLSNDGAVTFAAAGLIYQNNTVDIAPHFNKVPAIRVRVIFFLFISSQTIFSFLLKQKKVL